MSLIRALAVDVMDGNTIEVYSIGDVPYRTATITLARVFVPPLTRSEGRKAKQELKELINNREITYKTIANNPQHSRAEVWLDDFSVNDTMIQGGYGREFDWPPEPDWIRQ